MQRCRELGTYHGFNSTRVDNSHGQELVENLSPLLRGLKLHDKKKSDATAVAAAPAPEADGRGD